MRIPLNVPRKSLIIPLLSVILCLALTSLPALAGSGDGGGGSLECEARIKQIRDDIAIWIRKGGHTKSNGDKHLNLHDGMTVDQYGEAMLKVLPEGAIIPTCVTDAEALAATDPNRRVGVDGDPKTCVSFRDLDQSRHMYCNLDRFLKQDPTVQYQQIHHEYAISTGSVEVNHGSDSDYTVSRDISGYLREQKILMLAVLDDKPPKAPRTPREDDNLQQAFEPSYVNARLEHHAQSQLLVGMALTPGGIVGGTLQGKTGWGTGVLSFNNLDYKDRELNINPMVFDADMEVRLDMLRSTGTLSRLDVTGVGFGMLSTYRMDQLPTGTGLTENHYGEEAKPVVKNDFAVQKLGFQMAELKLDTEYSQPLNTRLFGRVEFLDPNLRLAYGNQGTYLAVGGALDPGIAPGKIGEMNSLDAIFVVRAKAFVEAKVQDLAVFSNEASLEYGAPIDVKESGTRFMTFEDTLSVAKIKNSPLVLSVQYDKGKSTDLSGQARNVQQMNFLIGFHN